MEYKQQVEEILEEFLANTPEVGRFCLKHLYARHQMRSLL